MKRQRDRGMDRRRYREMKIENMYRKRCKEAKRQRDKETVHF